MQTTTPGATNLNTAAVADTLPAPSALAQLDADLTTANAIYLLRDALEQIATLQAMASTARVEAETSRRKLAASEAEVARLRKVMGAAVTGLDDIGLESRDERRELLAISEMLEAATGEMLAVGRVI